MHPNLSVRFLPSEEPTIDSDLSEQLDEFLPPPISGLNACGVNNIKETSHRCRSGCPDRPARRK